MNKMECPYLNRFCEKLEEMKSDTLELINLNMKYCDGEFGQCEQYITYEKNQKLKEIHK